MADKVLGIILPRDNTKVNIGTAELPKWKAPFVPDYFRGEQEYKKGNYTDPHAKAYAEKTSGKVESVSPEFELLGLLGIKTLANASKRGLGWLYKVFKKPESEIANASLHYMPKTNKGDFVYNGNNYLKSRVEDGAVKRLGLDPDDPIIKDLFKEDYHPLNLNNPVEKEYIKSLLKDTNENYKRKVLNSDFTANAYKGNYFIAYDSNKINNREFNNFLNHERDHILNFYSKIKSKRPILEDLPDLEEFRRRMYKRGYTQENDTYINDVYKYLTENNGEELVARGTQLKDALEFTKADQKLTSKDIENLSATWRQHPDFNNDMNAFFAMIEGNNKAPDYFNWWSMGVIPAFINIKNMKNENTERKGRVNN